MLGFSFFFRVSIKNTLSLFTTLTFLLLAKGQGSLLTFLYSTTPHVLRHAVWVHIGMRDVLEGLSTRSPKRVSRKHTTVRSSDLGSASDSGSPHQLLEFPVPQFVQ